MSFYRVFIAAVAAFGLATSVFATDATNPQDTTNHDSSQQSVQVAGDQSADQPSSQGTEQKIDINKASKKELMGVKGVNAAKAKAIISYRKKHGGFKSLDELKQVSGFKKLKDDQLQSIQDQLTIN